MVRQAQLHTVSVHSAAAAGSQCTKKRPPPVIRQYPEVEAYVYDAITSIRAANGVVNSTLIASLFRGIVKAKHKELYKKFKFTRRWCRWWFGRTFDWTYKRGSTSGQKLPVDWEVQCANMVKRVSATAAKHKIQHPCFIINWDQTGCVLVPASKYTYSNIKVKQVPIVGHDEKRQITAVVGEYAGRRDAATAADLHWAGQEQAGAAICTKAERDHHQARTGLASDANVQPLELTGVHEGLHPPHHQAVGGRESQSTQRSAATRHSANRLLERAHQQGIPRVDAAELQFIPHPVRSG